MKHKNYDKRIIDSFNDPLTYKTLKTDLTNIYQQKKTNLF